MFGRKRPVPGPPEPPRYRVVGTERMRRATEAQRHGLVSIQDREIATFAGDDEGLRLALDEAERWLRDDEVEPWRDPVFHVNRFDDWCRVSAEIRTIRAGNYDYVWQRVDSPHPPSSNYWQPD